MMIIVITSLFCFLSLWKFRYNVAQFNNYPQFCRKTFTVQWCIVLEGLQSLQKGCSLVHWFHVTDCLKINGESGPKLQSNGISLVITSFPDMSNGGVDYIDLIYRFTSAGFFGFSCSRGFARPDRVIFPHSLDFLCAIFRKIAEHILSKQITNHHALFGWQDRYS